MALGCHATLADLNDHSGIASRWLLHALLLAFAYGVLGFGYAATFVDLAGVWANSSTFNHCFLIPFIAVYLGYTKRPELEQCAPLVSVYGLVYIAGNALLWTLGEVMSLAVLMHLAVVGMVIGCAWALLGQNVFRQLLFPFFYLYFAVPEGEFLVPYLQDWTALVMVGLLKLVGMPVFVEGRDVSIPSGNFTVAEACSGINYLIATLSVATMFAYLQFRSLKRRSIFMAAALVVPLVANGIRAFGIVIIAHLSNYTLAQGIDHFIYGWVFFGLVIGVLFWVGRYFSDIDEPLPPSVNKAVAAPLTTGAQASLILATALVLAFAPRAALRALDSARPMAAAIELKQVPGWRGPESESSALGSRVTGADQRLIGRYVGPDNAVVVVEIAYFRQQGENGELINHNNRVYDAETWRQISHAVRDVPQPAPLSKVNELRLRYSGDKQYLLWYWYDAQALRSSGGLPIKFAEGWARMRGLNVGSAMVSIRTEVAGDAAGAAQTLSAFLGTGAALLENLHAQP